MVDTVAPVKATLDHYYLTKTLGAGFSAKVKLAHKDDGSEYAIKIFDLSNSQNNAKFMNLLRDEVEATMKLNHQHIVKYHEFNEASIMKKANGKEATVAYIAQEPIMGGELYQYVNSTGAFSEKICRYFFKQMIKGLHYLHTQGLCHRDLKPENILLDKNFDVKIVDFGFAAPLAGRQGSGFNSTKLGSPMYMAPEILYNDEYQGQGADLFALAIILFSMRSRHQPFDKMAGKKDPFYKLIVQNRADLFWKAWQQYHPDDDNYYSDEFKDLITTMIDFYPQKRPLMADIIGHPWMQGECATHEEVVKEFEERKEMIKQAEKEQAVKAPGDSKSQTRRSVKVQNWTFVSGDMTAEEKADSYTVSPPLKPYGEVKKCTTTLYTDLLPEEVFRCLIKELDDGY
jgi:serine/threonine protein kinase